MKGVAKQIYERAREKCKSPFGGYELLDLRDLADICNQFTDEPEPISGEEIERLQKIKNITMGLVQCLINDGNHSEAVLELYELTQPTPPKDSK